MELSRRRSHWSAKVTQKELRIFEAGDEKLGLCLGGGAMTINSETKDLTSWSKMYWVVVSNIFYFHPYLGKMSILTNIFQRGWNHQLVWHLFVYHYFFWSIYCSIYLLRHVIFFDLFDTFNILGGIQPLRVVTTTNKFQLFNFHLEIWGNDLIWRTHICVPQPPPTLDPTNGQSLVDLDFLGLPIMFSSGIAASLCQQIRIEIKFTR